MSLRITLLTLVMLGLCGCQWLKPFINTNVPQAPVVFTQPGMTARQVVDAMQANAQRINQLESSVSVNVDGLPRLTGNLVIQTPKNLRLKAGLLGMTEMGVDVGSNDDVFWVWIKATAPGQQSNLYYARHDEYANSNAKKAIPLEPQWILDAIGLIQFNQDEQFDEPFIRMDDGNVQLSSIRNTSNGTIRRVFVLDPKYAWIKQQSIYINDRRVAYADAFKFQYLPDHQVSLPKQIRLHVDQPNGKPVSLVVNFSDFRINQFYGDPQQAWAMPQLSDVQMIDISRLQSQGMPNMAPVPQRQQLMQPIDTNGGYQPKPMPGIDQASSQSLKNP